MRIDKLPNYLRTYRKRAGLSQEELAYIVKLHDKSAWCNLERYRRQPSLRTALACEEIFDVPVSELFAGTKAAAARDARRRMWSLRRQLDARGGTTSLHRAKQKLQWLCRRLGEAIPCFSLS